MLSKGGVKAQSRRSQGAVKAHQGRSKVRATQDDFDAATAAQSGVRAPQRCDCEQREAPLRGKLWLTHLYGLCKKILTPVPVRRGEANSQLGQKPRAQ